MDPTTEKIQKAICDIDFGNGNQLKIKSIKAKLKSDMGSEISHLNLEIVGFFDAIDNRKTQ